jgi:hypothetical protein
VARLWATKARTEDAFSKLLDRFTLYLIPRPNPDGSEIFFRTPRWEHDGNARRTDDDRDATVGEDPPRDLNGDGLITAMRVEDGRGQYFPRPDDPRVMIKAEPTKNERAGWSIHVEGSDADEDEQIAEDPAGGVSFNQNFTFRYPYFQRGAGPHQVSEPETRAVADFCFSRPNIAAVLTFTPEDNLMHPWKPNSASDGARIKTAITSADAPYLEFIAEKYRALHGGKDAPTPPTGAGSFSQWAYFHYGRWSFAARGWWVPKVDPPAPKPGEKPADEKRGADDVSTLAWLTREKIDGFVPWTRVDHKSFPGKKVEIGGFKPFVLLNPPANLIDPLADKHSSFVAELLGLMPKVAVESLDVRSLGAGVFRVTAKVTNTGYLPTMSDMGRISREAYPMQLRLALPARATLVQGSARTRLDRLSGNGGNASYTWLVRLPAGSPTTVTCTVNSPSVGSHAVTGELKE